MEHHFTCLILLVEPRDCIVFGWLKHNSVKCNSVTKGSGKYDT
jgi:hypothetical protein